MINKGEYKTVCNKCYQKTGYRPNNVAKWKVARVY